jgi:uncharacterized protein YcbK (DUF882 family)
MTPRMLRRGVALLSLGGIFAIASVNATQDAIANGGTRSLTIYHAHTKEQETVTFKSFGSYNSAGLQKLNWMLRDWRQDEPTRMDPQLFDILWEVYRASGSSSPIHVVSAYRSPGTNAMLARRSRGVAKNSQHMSGRAMDFNLPDVSMSTVRDIGLRLQNGGVGYYPRANNPWVHLDTGGVRHWPKVSREHLARLFPDERTVHIPRDGKPMAGFETARAIIEARGGSVSSGYIDIAEGRATGRTLFQILFGGGEGDDEGDVVAQRGKKGRTAVASRGRNTQVAALPDQGEGNALAFFNQPNSSTSVAARQEAPALRPSRPTRPTPIEEPKPAAAAPEPPKPAEPKPVEPQKPVEVAAAQPRGQQVPLATRTDAVEQENGKRVQIALPPRRPSNFAELVAAASGKPALVTVQLPPTRPTAIASAAPETPVAAQEEQKPVQTASVGRQVNVALPQTRPATPAALQSAAVGLRTEPLPAAAAAFAPSPAPPAGRIIPAAPAQAAAPVRPAAPPTEAKDRRGLDSLISQVAMASGDGKIAPVAAPSVSAIAGVRTVTGRFEAKRDETPAGSGFTGSAIRPMSQGFR